MYEHTYDLFSVHKLTDYDNASQQRIEKYSYAFFGGDLLRGEDADLESFFDKTINLLNSKRELIKKLKSTSLDVIKDDIGSNIYEILKHGGINNIFDVRMNIHRSVLDRIYSHVPGIGPTKGKKIIEAMEKHGLYTNIYLDRIYPSGNNSQDMNNTDENLQNGKV